MKFQYPIGVKVKQDVQLGEGTMDLHRGGLYETFINYNEITSFGVGFEAINIKLMFLPLGLFFALMLGAIVGMKNTDLVFPIFLLSGLLALGLHLWFKKQGAAYKASGDTAKLPSSQSMIIIGTTRTRSNGQTRGYLIPFNSKQPQAHALLKELQSRFPEKYLGVDFMQHMIHRTGTQYVVRRAWKRANGDYFESDRNHNIPAGV